MPDERPPALPPEPEERLDFLLECSRTSFEELLFRVKHRDDWLKLQLLTQIVLLALSFGVEIAGVKATATTPNALMLVVPASFILVSLYVIEDRFIGLLSSYRGELAGREAQLTSRNTLIEPFESSRQMKECVSTTGTIRLLNQVAAFLLLPMGLAFYRLGRLADENLPYFLELVLDVVLLVGNGVLILSAFFRRRQQMLEAVQSRYKADSMGR